MPKVTVVSGPPAAGKSTLANSLQKDLNLPILAKDSIKESLYDSLGYSDRAYSRKIGKAAFELQFQLAKELVDNSVSFILETAFFFHSSANIRKVLAGADILQVWCSADVPILLERAKTRPRHPGHVDWDAAAEEELRSKIEAGTHNALDIGGTLIRLNTNDFTQPEFLQSYEKILAFYA
jgi:predicted kinase